MQIFAVLLALVVISATGFAQGLETPPLCVNTEENDGPWPTCDGSTGQASCGALAFASPTSPVTEIEDDLNEDVPVEVILEDIFRLLELGDEEIKLTEKNINLVVGMTGSGKSTLTAFVAGAHCRLYANLTAFDMIIWDKEGSVSNETIISKTLLPELTIDPETQSALYDCPGFSDTRNESVEIANSFFIKKVTDYADRVKITVVIPHSQLHPNDRSSFINLLVQLAVFVRNPAKLSNSIAIVSTNVIFTHNFKEWHMLNQYRCFFGIVRTELPQLWPDNPLRDRALQILDILHAQVETQLTRAGLFFQPQEEGCLDEMPIMQCNKGNLRHLMLEKTTYAEKEIEDFGYGLSDKALRIFDQIIDYVDTKIKSTVEDLAEVIEEDFQLAIEEYFSQNETATELMNRLFALRVSSYPISTSPGIQDPYLYAEEIIATVSTFTQLDLEAEFGNLTQLAEYLTFFRAASDNELPINPAEWVSPLLQLKATVMSIVNAQTSIVERHLKATVAEVATIVTSTLNGEIEAYFVGDREDEGLSGRLLALKNAAYPISNSSVIQDPEMHVEEIVESITLFLTTSPVEEFALLRTYGAHLTFISNVIEGELEITPREWIVPLIEAKAVAYEVIAHMSVVERRLIESVERAAAIVRVTLQTEIEAYVAGDREDDGLFGRLLALKNATYPISNSSVTHDPMAYIEEIIGSIEQFVTVDASLAEEFVILRAQGVQLQFISRVAEGELDITPKIWVVPLLEARTVVLTGLDALTEFLLTAVHEAYGNLFQSSLANLMRNISSTNDQHIKRDIVVLYRGRTEQLKNQMQSKLDSSPILQPYLRDTVTVLQTQLQEFADADQILALEKLYPRLELLANFGEIVWRGQDWARAFREVADVVTAEWEWIQPFLLGLYHDLIAEEVQSSGELHDWRATFGQVNANNFESFWTRLSLLPAIRNSDRSRIQSIATNEPVKLATLNNLLSRLLQPHPACIQPVDGVTFYAGNFLVLSKILNCIASFTEKPKTLALLVYHTLFMDTKLVGSTIDVEDNLNLLVISPKFQSANNATEIDLSGPPGAPPAQPSPNFGTNGQPGKPGQKAGNVYVIGQDFGSRPFTFRVNGGNGGGGQGGSRGGDGLKGTTRRYSVTSGDVGVLILQSECEAWDRLMFGAYIRVLLKPHSCNPPKDSNFPNDCPAGSHVRNEVTLYGLHGTNGGNGGHGGAGGYGGFGGIAVQITGIGPAAITNGSSGGSGVHGLGAGGGRGGQRGDSNIANIGTWWLNSNYCQIVDGPRYVPRFEYASDGSPGTNGGNQVGIQQPKPQAFNPAVFREYVNLFKVNAAGLQNDEFFHSFLPGFIDIINAHNNSIP